jgi:dihydrofolate reductase
MAVIHLCIAMSLDGFIADRTGTVDFLFEKPRFERDTDYERFYADIGMVLFGKNTYRQITQEISPGKWLYPDKRCVVFSHDTQGKIPEVEYTTLSPKTFVKTVCAQTDKPVWLFGGRQLIHSFMQDDLIDRYWIYVMPVLLGAGVPLFTPETARLPLAFTGVRTVDDRVKLFYDRDRDTTQAQHDT